MDSFPMKDVCGIPGVLTLGLILALVIISACTQKIPSPSPAGPGTDTGSQEIPGQPGETPAGQSCPGEPYGVSWSGTWVTSTNSQGIKMVQSGNFVIGTDNEWITGGLTTLSGTASGNPPKLVGTWNCPSQGNSGTFEFTMSDDGKSFSGKLTMSGIPGYFNAYGIRQ